MAGPKSVTVTLPGPPGPAGAALVSGPGQAVLSELSSGTQMVTSVKITSVNNKANVSVCLHVTVQTSGLQGSDRCADRDWFGWFGDLKVIY